MNLISKYLRSLIALYLVLHVAASDDVLTSKCTLQDSICLKEKIRIALNTITNGIPELVIEKLDKMFIDRIDIKLDNIVHEMTNVEIGGLKNATIIDVSVDEVLKLLSITFETMLSVKSNYTLSGFLFRLPIVGAGELNLNLKNVRFDIVVLYDIIKQQNGKYMLDLQDYRYGSIVQGGITYDYKNMFNGNKELSDRFHNIMNKKWTIITSSYGKAFYNSFIDKIYNAIKKYVGSKNLENVISF